MSKPWLIELSGTWVGGRLQVLVVEVCASWRVYRVGCPRIRGIENLKEYDYLRGTSIHLY